jgi:hypothetical protein
METVSFIGWLGLIVWVIAIFVKLYFFPSATDRELYDK